MATREASTACSTTKIPPFYRTADFLTLRGALARQSDVQLRRRDQKVSAALFHVTLPYQGPSRCHVQNIEVKWPPVRAELAINLSRCPRSPGACGYLVVACGSLFGTGLIFLDAGSPRLIWDGGIPRPPAGGRAPLRRFAPCVLRWKTLRVSSAPHPCGFEFLRLPTRKRSRFIRAWSAVFLRAGTEGFEPPTAGTKNRSSTVELRPNVWCCPKATRLVYLICEGIANAVE